MHDVWTRIWEENGAICQIKGREEFEDYVGKISWSRDIWIVTESSDNLEIVIEHTRWFAQNPDADLIGSFK